MARAFLLVLDSVGIGGATDAAAFGDSGANTIGHILDKTGGLDCPNLAALGFFHALDLASAHPGARDLMPATLKGFWGAAEEVSRGKDTPSGHWEIAGVPVRFDWGYFPHETPAFPQALLTAIYEKAGLSGSLANHHGSGTDIIRDYGEEHLRTGQPIFYTSADSVFQIAAHEEAFGLQRLYDLCEIVRVLVDDLNIGRVIARPFVGATAADFTRTGNRRDYSVPPPEPTLLDRIVAAGGRVLAVGKIGDIFAHQGVTEERKASGNEAIADATLKAMEDARDGDLVFSNFVDFDMLYGHRRDVPGYAAALDAFDRRLPGIMARLGDGDLMIITADHGCDPTWRGTDHTRERVPVVGWCQGASGLSVGLRPSFSDIGETVAEHLGLAPGPHGTSFLAGTGCRA